MIRTTFALAALLVSGLALAEETPAVDKRQENQSQRIEQGVESGQLTRPEARRLNSGQAKLERAETAAKADGDVTARERARLQKKSNVQSKRIYRQKHDGQDRKD